MRICQCTGKNVMLENETPARGDEGVVLSSTTMVEVKAIYGLVYAETLVLDGPHRGQTVYVPCGTEVTPE